MNNSQISHQQQVLFTPVSADRNQFAQSQQQSQAPPFGHNNIPSFANTMPLPGYARQPTEHQTTQFPSPQAVRNVDSFASCRNAMQGNPPIISHSVLQPRQHGGANTNFLTPSAPAANHFDRRLASYNFLTQQN